MTAVLYTDASYNEHHDIAACGFLVLVNAKAVSHIVYMVSGLGKVDRAEIWAMTTGLQYCFMMKGVTQIQAHTDCMMIVTQVKKKRKLWDYLDTVEMIKDDGIDYKLFHVRAHSKDEHNNRVDRSCNNALKNYLLKNKLEAQPWQKIKYSGRKKTKVA